VIGLNGHPPILPDPAFDDLRPVLTERMARLGTRFHAGQFAALMDPLIRQVLERGFHEAGAHEGTVWILDEAGENLIPAFNTGPDAERLMREFKQPLNAGLISMVFASEQPFLENEVWKNAQQSRLLDTLLAKQTCAMLAVPLHLVQTCRGVVSCVQLKKPGAPGPDPPGFRPEHLAGIQRMSTLLSRLIEFRWLGQMTGWTGG
jgi:hypothetical protein